MHVTTHVPTTGTAAPRHDLRTAGHGRVLVIDDDESMCRLVSDDLRQRGHEVVWVTDPHRVLPEVEQHDFDAVIADICLGPTTGLELCGAIVERKPDLPVIVITAFGSMDSAIAAIRAGAYDYIHKPIEMGTLALSVGRAVEHHHLQREVHRLRSSAHVTPHYEAIIGDSPAIKNMCELMSRLGDSEASVLITGESGSGKELVARALHSRGRHADGPFVALNCAAVPATLLESTLFGHVRGAFTDAKNSRDGLFVEATEGTLFLDEIGEMALEMQAKLLRVLQERRVRPVGGSEDVPFDCAIIAATNKQLDQEVLAGRFRDDLYYRIHVVGVDVPPLRERGNDVLLLAQHFLDDASARSNKAVRSLGADAARKLLDYDWPGNVRELRNIIERAVALTQHDTVTLEDLPHHIIDHRPTKFPTDEQDIEHMLTIEEVERRYIQRVLEAAAGNKTQAAKVLGIDRRTLYRKLERFAEG